MEAALQECKRLAVRRFSRIMQAGGKPVAWSYEVRDSNNVVAGTGKGFDTNKATMAAGRKKARELKASGSLPGGGVGTVGTRQDSEVPTRQGTTESGNPSRTTDCGTNRRLVAHVRPETFRGFSHSYPSSCLPPRHLLSHKHQ